MCVLGVNSMIVVVVMNVMIVVVSLSMKLFDVDVSVLMINGVMKLLSWLLLYVRFMKKLCDVVLLMIFVRNGLVFVKMLFMLKLVRKIVVISSNGFVDMIYMLMVSVLISR